MASRTIKTPGATTETKATEPTNEELKRQLEKVQAQLSELKKSTQVGTSASSGSTGEVQPKKHVPVLTEDGWTTKEVD